jgi:hypothetical protein
MRLIDKNIREIISGYDDILQAETEMRARWRPKLLTAYTQRKATLAARASSQQRTQIRVLISVILGMGLSLIGIGFSCRGIVEYGENIIGYCCGGPLLAVLGMLSLGATWLAQISRTNTKSARTPFHPLRSIIVHKDYQQKGIFPDLRSAWMEGLSGGLKDEVPDYPDHLNKNENEHAAQGERIFIRRLREHLDDHYYVLARLMQRPGEDVDVILIGPKGIWVFEVRHWSGEIYWDDQGWRRIQTNYERGGVEVTSQPEVGVPPDQQWIRAAAEVSRTLQARATWVLKRYPALEQVHGGIVFTKEEADLSFQPGRPAFWGTLNSWIETLHHVEPKIELDTRSILQLVEALLSCHWELAPAEQRRSMRAYARGVIQEAEDQLEEWVQRD